MKYILGLTGQTGSGKSSVRKIAEQHGFFVIDCDEVAHRVTEGEPAKTELVRAFSDKILNGDGTLSRKKLAAAAFESRQSTELLNKTVLPIIADEIKGIINNTKSDYILLDAPTLYESGIDEICSATAAVLAEEGIRRNRIIKRDNLSEQAAMLRLSAAKGDDFYKQRANRIFYNNGDFDRFLTEFSVFLKDISGGN